MTYSKKILFNPATKMFLDIDSSLFHEEPIYMKEPNHLMEFDFTTEYLTKRFKHKDYQYLRDAINRCEMKVIQLIVL